MSTFYQPLVCKQRLIQKFNHTAKTYHHAAALNHEVGSRLVENLNFMKIQPRMILDLGAGCGYISNLLRNTYPVAEIIALDMAEQRLHVGKKMTSSKKIHWLCADAEQFPLKPNSMELIVSNLMLPWVTNLSQLFENCLSWLKPGGLFLFSTPGMGTLPELEASWGWADDFPHVHPNHELHDIGDALKNAGFEDAVVNQEKLILSYSSVLELVRDLKNLGSSNALSTRRNTLTGKQRWDKFLSGYENFRDEQHRIPATCFILYSHAWKPKQTISKTSDGMIEINVPIHAIQNRSKTNHHHQKSNKTNQQQSQNSQCE